MLTATRVAAGAAVVAALLSLASAILFYCLTRQADETAKRAVGVYERQFGVMEAQGRPWIKADAILEKPVRFTDWANGKYIEVAMTFSLKNYGSVPATNIRIYSVMWADSPTNRKNLDVNEEGLCESAENAAKNDPTGGRAAFPQEARTQEVRSQGAGFERGQPDWFYILGCIDYTYGQNRHGKTGFRYRLAKVAGPHLIGIPFIEGNPVFEPPIDPGLLKEGYPPNPPRVGFMAAKDLLFDDNVDNGNWAK